MHMEDLLADLGMPASRCLTGFCLSSLVPNSDGILNDALGYHHLNFIFRATWPGVKSLGLVTPFKFAFLSRSLLHGSHVHEECACLAPKLRARERRASIT